MRLNKRIRIGLCLVVFLSCSWLSFGQAARQDPRTRVASVNGEAITLAEVDAVMAQRPVALNAPTANQARQQRLEIITALIDDMLLQQFFRDHGAKVDPKIVNAQFAALETSLKTQNKTLNEYLRELNQTETQVRSNLTMLLQLDRYVKDHTSEIDMRNYFEANKDYFEGVTVRTSHIVIRTADALPAEREKIRAQLMRIRSDIMAGRIDFADAARQFSHCPSSPKGGDIGFIARKFQNIDEAYAKAAFALKNGEISEIVETDFGMHLIKVTERTEGKPVKFEQAADTVRDCYAEELRVALLNDLRKKAKIAVTLP